MPIVRVEMRALRLGQILIFSFAFLLVTSPFSKAEEQSSILTRQVKAIVETIDSLNRPSRPHCLGLPGEEVEATSEKRRWELAGFDNAKINKVPLQEIYGQNSSTPKFTHQFDLTIVRFRNSEWTDEMIMHRLRRTARIYQTCGVKIGEIKFVDSDAPNNRVDLRNDTYTKNSAVGGNYDIAKITPSEDRPIVYFFRSFSDGVIANTCPSYRCKDEPLENTAWMTTDDNEDYRRAIPHYETLAHELGHLLMNTAHVTGDESNLMQGSYYRLNDKLTKDQCRDVKESELVREV